MSSQQTNINSQTAFNTNKNSNSTQNRIDNVINNNRKDFLKLRRNINKTLRYNNHLATFQIHEDNKSTPKSMFFERYPIPFFQEDQEYIDKYNLIVENTQQETTNLIKSTLNKRLIKAKEDMIIYEEDFIKLNKYSEFEIKDIVRSITKFEENALLDTFIKSKQKAEKCHSRPFKPVTTFLNNQSSYSNTSNITHKSHNKSSTPNNYRTRRVDFNKDDKTIDNTFQHNHSNINSQNNNKFNNDYINDNFQNNNKNLRSHHNNNNQAFTTDRNTFDKRSYYNYTNNNHNNNQANNNNNNQNNNYNNNNNLGFHQVQQKQNQVQYLHQYQNYQAF